MIKNNHLRNVVLLVKSIISEGITHVVISPGSRNAPFINLFTASTAFKTYIVVDERSAGFIALGISKETRLPVVLVCTSGTAALNYSPAIAEAYYQQIPLLIITADRPIKWLNHSEGQQINQTNVYKNFTAASFLYDTKREASELKTEVYNAINELKSKSRPVHLNVPIDEPLYEAEVLTGINETKGNFQYNNPDFTLGSLNFDGTLKQKIVVVLGNMPPDEEFSKALNELNKSENLVIVAEANSNCNLDNIIRTPDLFFTSLDDNQKELFSPDLLITIGTHILSKQLKSYFREFSPDAHWHINRFNYFPNTYDCLTKSILADPLWFVSRLNEIMQHNTVRYKSTWLKHYNTIQDRINTESKALVWSEFSAFAECYKSLPAKCSLHLGNSMTVRYPEFLNLRTDINHVTNRGTSGIDGSLSTAIGSAKANSLKQHIIILGDLSFMYDSNALWQDELPQNLKVIILNNGGGGIFDFIPGPQKNNNYKRNFIAAHKKNFEYLAKHYEIPYLKVVNGVELKTALKGFFEENSFSIIEIETNFKENNKILKQYISQIKK